tara:strand:+ start:4808 stop:5026 length:219 start_codon:yes stop_codon:yes gene_type:complete
MTNNQQRKNSVTFYIDDETMKKLTELKNISHIKFEGKNHLNQLYIDIIQQYYENNNPIDITVEYGKKLKENK